MTAIAYRDGVIAADTMTVISTGAKVVDREKVFKYKGHLFGVCGDDCPEPEELKEWFDHSTSLRVFKFVCLMVEPNGSISIFGQDGRLLPIRQKFFAIGAGAAVCLGAMELGASAAQAVKAAIKWCDQCGGSVVQRRLR